jgi:hypothetical protein
MTELAMQALSGVVLDVGDMVTRVGFGPSDHVQTVSDLDGGVVHRLGTALDRAPVTKKVTLVAELNLISTVRWAQRSVRS